MKRHAQHRNIRELPVIAATLLALLLPQANAPAQDVADNATALTTTQQTLRSPADLDQLLGPIALYPDPLIGLILPAAAVPSQIVEADRYLQNGGDPNQISVQPWDPAVQGLAHYPTVLTWMDNNLAWTTEIGVAFTLQQSDVMDSIQRLRSEAEAQGNLTSSPQENIVDEDGEVDIEPANPDDMYIPDYSWNTIYTDPGVYCTFGVGLPIGAWLGFDWDWHNHHLIHWGSGHPRPRDWWMRSPGDRRKEIASAHPPTWQAPNRGGSIMVSGRDRGYAERAATRPDLLPKVAGARGGERTTMPRESAPRVSVTTIGHAPQSFRTPELRSRAVEPRTPIERSAPAESAFGGSETSREVRQSSSRGAESRSFGFSSSGGSVRSSGGGGGGGGGGGSRGGGRR